MFSSGVTSYDFTDALSKAYDDGFNPPMKDVGGFFGIWSGDVNQDGTVDGTGDMTEIDNDNNDFSFGYFGSFTGYSTDCSGDGATASDDIIIVDNNQNLFLFYARPPF